MDDWMDVREAMPPAAVLVDIWADGKRHTDCAYDEASAHWNWMGDPDYPQGRMILGAVTHWMARPAPPVELNGIKLMLFLARLRFRQAAGLVAP